MVTLSRRQSILLVTLFVVANIVRVETALAADSTTHNSSEESHGNETNPHISNGHVRVFSALLFPWIAELLGVITLHILSRYAPDIPYTAVLFVEGILLGVFHQTSRGPNMEETWGQLGDSIQTWSTIDPHLLLFAFLPALLFGDAIETNWFLFKQSFWQVLWLAVPGMLGGAALTAVLAYGILPYQWQFPLCMTFGSILAATDPVAVVALLKEVGASPSLTMLISGESMLNDGTAIVMFDIFSNMYLHNEGSPLGENFTVASGFAKFFKMSLGGALIGITFGILTIMWLSFLNRRLEENDATMQLSLTMCVAYLSYYFADGVLATSGVLSVVFAGTFIAAFAKPLISSAETMEHVWKAIEHLGNTLLFVLGGVVWGNVVADAERDGHIVAQDWGLLLAMYIVVLVSRAVMIGVSYPFLSKIGVSATKEDALFMTWGGLRGAVGIALALSLDQRIQLELPGNFNALQTGSRVIFHVGGIAVLTLVINGRSSALVLRRLGLTGTSNARKKVLAAVHARMERVALYTFNKALKQELFACVDPEAVISLVPMLAPGTLKRKESYLALRKKLESRRRLASFPRRSPSTLKYNRAFEYNQVVVTLREVFLDLLRAAYWGLIRDGVLREDSFSAYVLLQSCDIAARDASKGLALNDWDAVASASNSIEYRIDRTINFVMGKAPLAKKHDVIFKQEQLKVHSGLCFIKAHHKAQKELSTYYGCMRLDEDDDTARYSNDDEEDREDKVVIQESNMEVQKAARVIDSVDPRLVSSTINKTVAAIVLDAQGKYIRRAQEEGMIQEKEAQVMFHEVQQELAALHWANHHKLKSDPAIVRQGSQGWCVHMVERHSGSEMESQLSTPMDVFNIDGIESAVKAADRAIGMEQFSALQMPNVRRRVGSMGTMHPILEGDETSSRAKRAQSSGQILNIGRLQQHESFATIVDEDKDEDEEEVVEIFDGDFNLDNNDAGPSLSDTTAESTASFNGKMNDAGNCDAGKKTTVVTDKSDMNDTIQPADTSDHAEGSDAGGVKTKDGDTSSNNAGSDVSSISTATKKIDDISTATKKDDDNSTATKKDDDNSTATKKDDDNSSSSTTSKTTNNNSDVDVTNSNDTMSIS